VANTIGFSQKLKGSFSQAIDIFEEFAGISDTNKSSTAKHDIFTQLKQQYGDLSLVDQRYADYIRFIVFEKNK
jgi:uncharacterized protein YfbU (UPF0304 family)